MSMTEWSIQKSVVFLPLQVSFFFSLIGNDIFRNVQLVF